MECKQEVFPGQKITYCPNFSTDKNDVKTQQKSKTKKKK